MAKARAGSSLDHVKQGSALLNQLMNLNKAGQNSSSGAGDSLARVGESITDKDPVSSAVSGLMSGLGAGMKVSEATANRKSMEGMEENIMALMRENNEVAARNQQIEQDQLAQRNLVEAAGRSAGSFVAINGYRDDPEIFKERKIQAANDFFKAANLPYIADQADQQNLSNINLRAKLLDDNGNATDISKDFNIPYELKVMAGSTDDALLAQSLTKAADDMLASDPEGYEARKLAIQKQNAETQEKKQATWQKSVDNQSFDNKVKLEQIKKVDKLDDIISKTDISLRNLDEIDNIITNNPNILQSTIAPIWANTEPSMIGQAVRQLTNKISPEESTAITRMNKLLNELVIEKAELFTRQNQFIEKVGSRAVPNTAMTPDAFKQQVNDMREQIRYTNNNARNKRNLYGQGLMGDAPSGFTPPANPNVATNASGEGMVRVKLPNGQTGQMPLANAQKIQGIEILS